MHPYAVFDLHCDTLTAFDAPHRCEDTLNDPAAHLSLSAMPQNVQWAQCFAVFLPDSLPAHQAETYYRSHVDSFYRQMDKFSSLVLPCRTAADVERAWAQGKTAAILTAENGSALCGQEERVEELAQDGVRMLTLTWNGPNALGSGNLTDSGLTPFGKRAVGLMEEAGILVDVSHLNDAGFDDLLKTATRPFAASHSNARAVCPHRRNLTDGQIREMIRRRCLIGLNYYISFLQEDGHPTPDDLLRHLDHILELGGEDALALGSDFDGADLPGWLNSPRKVVSLYQLLRQRGYSKELCEKLFYRNALAFFRTNLG